jgi:hypothetical protein
MKRILILITVIGSLAAFNSCKKKYDEPPIADETKGKVYSVAELTAIANCTNGCSHRFTSDSYLIGVVIADEVSGNFYKEIYVRDRYNTGGIHLDMKASHCNFFVGDSVHLNLKGYDVNLNSQTGLLEVDTVDFEKTMVKFASGATPQPIQIDLGCDDPINHLCDLVTINNVAFLPADAGQIWADPISQTSINHVLQSCGGNSLTVRTSNYAHFAQQLTPTGRGSITGIATAYSGTSQLAIRNTGEVSMNGPACGAVYHTKNFNDASLTSGGWAVQTVTGTAAWAYSTFGTAKFAKVSGYYSSTNNNTETWLISPALNLSASSNPVLTFMTAAKFSGVNLEVWISTNYTSGSPSTAAWTYASGFKLSPNNPGSYAWTPSCLVSLNMFKNTNTRIAFKYQSTTSGATTYELDDITIREN